MKSSADFKNTHAAIAKPNFQYCRELPLDIYICSPHPMLSSMSFENSLQRPKAEAQRDSWKKISQLLVRLSWKMKLNRIFKSKLLPILDSNAHSAVIDVLNQSLKRSLVYL